MPYLCPEFFVTRHMTKIKITAPREFWSSYENTFILCGPLRRKSNLKPQIFSVFSLNSFLTISSCFIALALLVKYKIFPKPATGNCQWMHPRNWLSLQVMPLDVAARTPLFLLLLSHFHIWVPAIKAWDSLVFLDHFQIKQGQLVLLIVQLYWTVYYM